MNSSIVYVVSGVASLPEGCFAMQGHNKVYFNPGSGGNYKEDYWIICKSGKYIDYPYTVYTKEHNLNTKMVF